MVRGGIRIESDKLVTELERNGLKIFLMNNPPPFCILYGSRQWYFETLEEIEYAVLTEERLAYKRIYELALEYWNENVDKSVLPTL